jgi:glycosyltransferase involved in cell wall biosynthesis
MGWSLFEVDMRRAIRPLHDARCAIQIRRVYETFRPDVVHAHSSKAGALSRIATLGMTHRPRIVYTPHSIASNMSPVFGAIEKVLALRLDILSAVSQSEREELRHLDLVTPERVHVVFPTVPSDVYVPRNRADARRELGFGDGPLMVGVGRLTRQKDPLAFVQLAAALRRTFPDLRAVWVGDGELRPLMEEDIRARSLGDCVSITGWIGDTRPYIAAANVFVSTSLYESFGYVTAEAFAMERPVVASEIVGTVDVVQHDTHEQLFPPGDLRAAEVKAARILRDGEFATNLALRGRAFVNATFSVAATRRGLLATYDAALATSPLLLPQLRDGVRDVEAAHVERASVSADA